MKSGCSESNASGVCWSDCESTSSCHHTSLSVHATSEFVRLTTSTFSTEGAAATASSTAGLSGNGLPRRY